MEEDKQTLYNDELLDILSDGAIIFNMSGEVIQPSHRVPTEPHVHSSVNEMTPLSTNDLFKLLNNEEGIPSVVLGKIRQGEQTYSPSEHTFMQEQIDYTQLPIRGDFATIKEGGHLKRALSFSRNITVELTQKHILNTALQRTKTYPWYYDIDRSEFILDNRCFKRLGTSTGESNTPTMEEYVNMVHPDNRQVTADAFIAQLSGMETFDKPVPFRLHRGGEAWGWFKGQSIYIANISGHPYRLVGICTSIQEYKDIENTLIEACKKVEESDRLKMAFLANISHEVRTPLNAVIGFPDVTGPTYDELSEEERAGFVRLISVNSEHLVRLTDDILDLSKVKSNMVRFTFTNCFLRFLMIDVGKEQTMKPISEVEIRASLPSEDVYISANATHLKQIISNFINDTRKFTEKGYIHFGYAVDSVDVSSVHVLMENTGPGIPKECQRKIFDRFYKVDTFKRGIGLELSICKTIAEHLQRDIFVESETGKDSRFAVTLPFERQSKD